MKLFIDSYNIQDLLKKIPQLDKYNVKHKSQMEIYSDEGIYIVDDIKLFKLIINDQPIVTIKNYYNKCNLIIDKSTVKTIETTQVPPFHLSLQTVIFYYSLVEKSNIKLVIQGKYDLKELINSEKDDKYYGFLPCDFYFEVSDEVDINNILFKEEFNVFLSLLN